MYKHRAVTIDENRVANENLVPRFFDYAFSPYSLKTITKLIDRRINPDIGSNDIAQARHHVFGLVTGLIMLPVFSLMYMLGGGTSWVFHLVMLTPFSMRLAQFIKMPAELDIDSQINARQKLFSWQLIALTLITGGASSPAFPWFLGMISQAALSQKGDAQLQQVNQGLLFASISVVITFIPILPNVIPEDTRVWLLSVSIILVIIQIWAGHSIVLGQRQVRLELSGLLKQRELVTGLIRNESTQLILQKLSKSGAGGRFSLFRLDVSSAELAIQENQLLYNKVRLAEILAHRCPDDCVFAALGRDRVLVLYSDRYVKVMEPVIESIGQSWPQLAISSCGLYEICRSKRLTSSSVLEQCGVS